METQWWSLVLFEAEVQLTGRQVPEKLAVRLC